MAYSKVILNGTAIMDATTATAVAADITSPKTAMLADGVMTTGTGSGGSGGSTWTRPEDWPDISAMDYTNEVVYMTYLADVPSGFCFFSFRTSTGSYTVEVGEIVNGAFVAEDTYTLNSNANCQHYFGSPSGGYKVLRAKPLTGSFTGFSFNKASAFSADGVQRWGEAQGLLEFWAKLGTLTNNDGFFKNQRFVQNIHLGSVKLPSSINSIVEGTRALRQIDAESWDTSDVATMSYAFSGCGLRSASISGWDTTSLTAINDMFYGSRFVELDLNSWDVSRCTSFHYLFESCINLVKVVVTDWDTSSVTTFRELFYDAQELASADFSKWDTSSATDMQSMFYNCRRLPSLDLSDWDFSTVTNTSKFLQGTLTISSITFPDSLSTVGENAFNNARNLFEFHFQSTTPPTLANTNAFNNMTDAGGRKIYVPYSADHSVLNAYKTASNWSTYASYIFEEAAP